MTLSFPSSTSFPLIFPSYVSLLSIAHLSIHHMDAALTPTQQHPSADPRCTTKLQATTRDRRPLRHAASRQSTRNLSPVAWASTPSSTVMMPLPRTHPLVLFPPPLLLRKGPVEATGEGTKQARRQLRQLRVRRHLSLCHYYLTPELRCNSSTMGPMVPFSRTGAPSPSGTPANSLLQLASPLAVSSCLSRVQQHTSRRPHIKRRSDTEVSHSINRRSSTTARCKSTTPWIDG